MSSRAFFARWRAARSTRSLRLRTASAESAAASRPPNATSRTATATKTAIISRAPSAFSFGEREADQDVALDAEHLLLVAGLRVIEAQQVKHSVRGQQQQLVEHRMTGLLGLGHRHLRAEHDVAEQTGRGDLVIAA